MIKHLSITRLFLLFAAMALYVNTSAQQIFITTNYVPTPSIGMLFFSPDPATPMFVTFTVANNSNKPIALTEVSQYHVGSDVQFQDASGNPTFKLNQNGQIYSLWASKTKLTGAPTPILPTNDWTPVGTGQPISTSTNAIVPVITKNDGLYYVLCPGEIARFALVTDSIVYAAAASALSPTNFTATGINVNLASADGGQYVGKFPGSSQSVTTGSPYPYYGFRGGIGFDTGGITPPKPIIEAIPTSICKGDSTMLVAKLPADATCAFPNPVFNWTWVGGGSATGDTVVVPNIQETTQFNCTATSGGNTSEPSSVKVVVNLPEPPLVTGKFAYCVHDQFEPLTVQADSIEWYYVPKGGSALPVAPTINTDLGPQKDTFYVAQFKNGCYSDRTRVILSAATKPAKPIVTTPLYYCEGQPALPLEAIGTDLLWYYFSTGGIPTSIAPTPPTSVRNKFDYYVANTNDGCEGPRERIEVFVEFRPNGLIVPSRDRLCQGDTMVLEYYGSAFDSSVFHWKIPSAGATLENDPDSLTKGPFVIRFDKAGTYNIELSVGSGACFSELYTQPIMVDSIPYAVITANQHACQGASELVSLEYYDETIDTFKWDFGAGSRTTHYATDQGPYGVIWDEPGEPVIALTIIQGNCADTILDTIEVRPYPEAGIDVDKKNEVYCAGDSIRVKAHFINSGSEYTWGPNRYFDTYNTLPATYAIVDFTSYITLNVKDQYGCEHSDSVMIKTEPCCKLTFPSAFSPNNDGKNDFFHLLNVREFDNYNMTNSLNYDVRTFRVMNRWGVTVFESANELRGWDGNFNGEPQDMGTYYWFVSYMCGGKLMSEKGEVMLVR